MIRVFSIVLVVAVIALSIGLYDIKYRAEAAEKRAAQIERDIASEQEGIRVLRAEWSYLNQPERIQELAKRYTGLEPMKASQIGSFADVPMPHKADDFYAPSGRKLLGGYAGIAPTDIGAAERTIR
jgi:cell division protein FtsL